MWVLKEGVSGHVSHTIPKLVAYLRLFRLLVHIAGCVEIAGPVTIFFSQSREKNRPNVVIII
jgi:hypothetical protein